MPSLEWPIMSASTFAEVARQHPTGLGASIYLLRGDADPIVGGGVLVQLVNQPHVGRVASPTSSIVRLSTVRAR